jgi:hypothetical protein
MARKTRKTRKKSKRQLGSGFGSAFYRLQGAIKARSDHTMDAIKARSDHTMDAIKARSEHTMDTIRTHAKNARSATTEKFEDLTTQAAGQFNSLKTQATSAIDNVSENINPQQIHQNINNNMVHVSNLGKQHLNTIHTNVVQGAHQLGNRIGNPRNNITQAALQGKQQLGVHANTIHRNATRGMYNLDNRVRNQYGLLNSPKKLEDLKKSTNVQLNHYPKGGYRKRKHNKRQKTRRKKIGGDYSIWAIKAMRKAHRNRKPRKYKATTQKIHPSKLLKNRSRIKSYPNKSPGRKTKRHKR